MKGRVPACLLASLLVRRPVLPVALLAAQKQERRRGVTRRRPHMKCVSILKLSGDEVHYSF
jgi:hypothetical protein